MLMYTCCQPLLLAHTEVGGALWPELAAPDALVIGIAHLQRPGICGVWIFTWATWVLECLCSTWLLSGVCKDSIAYTELTELWGAALLTSVVLLCVCGMCMCCTS
jgi:hypothetical protein